MMARRCPRGLEYHRIAQLKGFLRHLSGVCAKTAAWALQGHMVPTKAPMPATVGAEWDNRTSAHDRSFGEPCR